MSITGSQPPPRTWCLLGRKAGDNAQLRALAKGLGWPFEEKQIVARPWELVPHLALRRTLLGIDRARSSHLAAPWPDLVLSAGRRNEPVARWIQARAGGRTKLVHLGRPWARLEHWDRIITTPQYFLPMGSRVVHNQLPLCDVAEDRLARAAERWAPRWATLPRPWIAVLIGGDSGKFVFTPEKGRRLGALANQLARQARGSLLVTDSARSASRAVEPCLSELTAPRWVYRQHSGGDNPYSALLALADAFVVTGESMSMLTEAASRNRPLFLFDLGDEGRWWTRLHAWRSKPLSHHLAMALLPRRFRRDIGRIQEALIGSGQAVWLDREGARRSIAEVASEARGGTADIVREDLERAVAAVRALFPALYSGPMQPESSARG